jgi:RNA polymerase sigma-70 factor (ECF subfamily)
MVEFEEIAAEFGPAIARIAASYERNPATQQDLAQEVLVAIFKSLPALRDPARLRPFVFRIVHNRCLSHVIKYANKPKMESLNDDLPGGEDNPQRHLLAGERSRCLLDAVRTLEIPYRQVVTLLLEDMSYAEIAEALGMTISNVGVRVNRAKSQLRALLNEHE